MNSKPDTCRHGRRRRSRQSLSKTRTTGVSLEGTFVLAVLEVPEFDGAILGTAGELCVLRVDRETGHVSTMSLQCMTRGWLWQKQFLHFDFSFGCTLTASQLLFECFDFVLEVVNLLLQCDDALEAQLELLAIGIDLVGDSHLSGEGASSVLIAVVVHVL
jgi:hypothetical protein